MLISFLQRNKILRKIVYRLGDIRAKDLITRIEPFLSPNDKVIDIGCGSCNVTKVLLDKKYKVTPIDIQNLSFVDSISPVIYDGKRLPYEDNHFEVSLMLTILHHTPHPEMIIQEAKRVSKKVIIIEDIYINWIHKYMTYFFDSLINLEFKGHPHTNQNDKGWKKTFKKLGFKLIESKYQYSFIVFKQATYALIESEQSTS